MDKPYKSIADQIELLESRGIVNTYSDRSEIVAHILKEMGFSEQNIPH